MPLDFTIPPLPSTLATALQQKINQKTKPPGALAQLEALANFGGFEIAMMAGAYLQAAELGMVVMVDGFIASAALLVAVRCYPAVLGYCVFSHVSNERGHQALLNCFNANALLKLDMRLGEGSGIAIA